VQTKYFRQNHKYVDIIKKNIFTKNTKDKEFTNERFKQTYIPVT